MFHVFHVVFYIVGLRCTRHHTHTHAYSHMRARTKDVEHVEHA